MKKLALIAQLNQCSRRKPGAIVIKSCPITRFVFNYAKLYAYKCEISCLD